MIYYVLYRAHLFYLNHVYKISLISSIIHILSLVTFTDSTTITFTFIIYYKTLRTHHETVSRLIPSP